MNYSSLVPGIFMNEKLHHEYTWIMNIINMNIHEPREITIQTCKILCKIYNSYPPLKLFYASRLNMNKYEYSYSWNKREIITESTQF